MDVPSFYTISSSSSAGSSITEDNAPLTPPSPTTHDTSRSAYHITDIASFAANLQDAANSAFPNRGRSRYHTVNVCLIRWEQDELNVKAELDQLHDVFDKLYGFNTEIWLIPSSASQIQLTSMTCTFLQKFDAEGNLFIVYYGGHGKINDARQNQWWCHSGLGSSFVDWSAIQTLFGMAVSDVLVLLDCCAAASSAPGSGTGIMEAIAACGWETRAPPPGKYSFTNTLIEVLEDWVAKPSFSAAMLHTEVLFVLKHKRPERGRDRRRLEWCSTPVHWVYTANPKAMGIEISSLRRTETAKKPADDLPLQRATTYMDSMDIDDEELDGNELAACCPDGDYKVPHVLISVALEGDQGTLDAASCRRWLADFPALVKYATVEGVYKGFSTLVTLSVPMMVWDLLPDHPACSFIGYVVSPNKFTQQPIMSETASTHGAQTVRKEYSRSMSRRNARDPFLSSCDSSYGSEYSPNRGISRPRHEAAYQSDSDEVWEDELASSSEDNASDWDIPPSPPLAHTSQSNASMTFPRINVNQDSTTGKSVITDLLRNTEDSRAIPIPIPISSRPGTPASPRELRRNMLADELTASLRQHLLWERQARAQLAELQRLPRLRSSTDDLGPNEKHRRACSRSF